MPDETHARTFPPSRPSQRPTRSPKYRSLPRQSPGLTGAAPPGTRARRPGRSRPPPPSRHPCSAAPPMAPAVEPQPCPRPPPAPPAPTPAHHGVSGATIALAVVGALIMGAIAGVAGGFLGGQLAQGPGSGLAVKAQKITVVPQTTEEPVVAAAAAAVPSVVNIDVSSGQAIGRRERSAQLAPERADEGQRLRRGVQEGRRTAARTSSRTTTSSRTRPRSPSRDAAGKALRRARSSAATLTPTSRSCASPRTSPSSTSATPRSSQVGPDGRRHRLAVRLRALRDLRRRLGARPLALQRRQQATTPATRSPTSSRPTPPSIRATPAARSSTAPAMLVGINTAIYSDTGQNGGIGFAIPVNTAARVADELIAGGKVGHPFIGLIGSTVDADVAAEKKLPVEQGAYVESLTKGAGAEKAGVKVGDVVTAVDGTDIRSMDDLVVAVRRHAIGDTAKLTVRRGDQTLTFDVVVGDKPADFKMPSTRHRLRPRRASSQSPPARPYQEGPGESPGPSSSRELVAKLASDFFLLK